MRFVPSWGLFLAMVGGGLGCGSDDAADRDRDAAPASGDDDGGSPDDGAPDSGAPDSGAPDAGGSEGGAADGGAADASSADGDSSGSVCTACGDCEESQRVTSARHVAPPVDYPDLPPTGGDHAGCWTSYRVHEVEVADEYWVHNLEHGAVVFLYNCPEGCSAELAQLEALTSGRPFALVTPYAALEPGSFAAVAWGHRLVSQCFDEDALRRFYEAHVDRAPESITGDGSC